MKGEQSAQDKAKRSAEDWVAIARKFGEECVKIQHDAKLSIDQKLEQRKALGDKIIQDIKEDLHLAEEDKRQMLDSIQNYMHEWQAMHDLIQQEESSSKKK